MSAETFLPWIPVFPLLGFLVNGLLYLVAHSRLGGKDAPLGSHGHGDAHGAGPRGRARGHDDHGAGHGGHGDHHDIPFKAVHTWVGPIASGLSFVFALLAIVSWWTETHGHHPIVATLWTWIPMGTNAGWFGSPDFSVDVAFRIDPLSALMLGFVTFIGTLIHVYSVGYMGHDEGYGQFFAYLNLFMFAMLTLVLGANLAILFVGWEGVGLCSYLLIGYYNTKDFAADAGKKAFVMNRIGDAGFLMGLFACVAMFGTVDFGEDVRGRRREPGDLRRGRPDDLRLPRPLRRRDGQERADPPLRLAPGRDGRPDARLGPHPRRDDGHRGRLHGRPLQRLLPDLPRVGAEDARREPHRLGPPDARRLVRRRGRRRDHGLRRRDDRPRPDRHQEGPRLLHRLAARLHVPRLRRPGVRRGDVPRLHPRLVQGLPLPRLRLGHPRPLGRAGDDGDGRAAREDPAHLPDDAHLDARDRRGAGPRRLLLEGPDPRARRS